MRTFFTYVICRSSYVYYAVLFDGLCFNLLNYNDSQSKSAWPLGIGRVIRTNQSLSV